MRRPTLPKAIRPRWETPDPPGVCGTYGDDVITWARRELGITMGRWQAYVLRKALRYDANGDLIHRIVLTSTGRQNGKSVIVRGFAGWELDEGQRLPPFAGWTTMLAAAHDAKQARIIYASVLADLLSIPRLRAAQRGRYAPVRLTEYRGVQVNGITLDTVTNQPGSARGLSAGAICWDEMLTQTDWDMWAALAPTQSAQRSPIMILTSTAGTPESVVLRSFYDRVVAGDDDPAFYGAWWESEDPDAGLDWRQLKMANPALDEGRLTRHAIEAEYRTYPRDLWRRERLNHWIDVSAPGAINAAAWRAIQVPMPLADADPPYVLGIDIQPGWERAAIVVAGRRPDGRVGVEVWRDLRAESGQITPELLISEAEAFPRPVSAVLYDSVSGAAGAFGRHAPWGVEWTALKPHEVVAACMDTTEAILSGKLAADDPLLDKQISWTARRNVGSEGAFRFTRADSAGPIDAVFAMTFAVRGILQAPPPPKIT